MWNASTNNASSVSGKNSNYYKGVSLTLANIWPDAAHTDVYKCWIKLGTWLTCYLTLAVYDLKLVVNRIHTCTRINHKTAVRRHSLCIFLIIWLIAISKSNRSSKTRAENFFIGILPSPWEQPAAWSWWATGVSAKSDFDWDMSSYHYFLSLLWLKNSTFIVLSRQKLR